MHLKWKVMACTLKKDPESHCVIFNPKGIVMACYKLQFTEGERDSTEWVTRNFWVSWRAAETLGYLLVQVSLCTQSAPAVGGETWYHQDFWICLIQRIQAAFIQQKSESLTVQSSCLTECCCFISFLRSTEMLRKPGKLNQSVEVCLEKVFSSHFLFVT